MTTMMRCFGLFLLLASTGCLSEGGGPLDQGGQGAFTPMGSPTGHREGAPFSPRIVKQLEARGIKVHQDPQPEPERTTVEQAWVVQGNPMVEVQELDTSLGEPEKYVTHVEIVWPNVVREDTTNPYIDYGSEGKRASCSGTLVGDRAVLTAGHCVMAYKKIGHKPDGTRVKAIVRAFSNTVRPRRNGNFGAVERQPHGAIKVKEGIWRFEAWPGDDGSYAADHDFAVLELCEPPIGSIPPTTVRAAPSSTQGLTFEAVHYPSASARDFRMYRSIGEVGDVYESHQDFHETSLSIEPASSGGGVYEVGSNGAVVDGVLGLVNAELGFCNVFPNACSVEGEPFTGPSGKQLVTREPGQQAAGFPNRALMFSDAIVKDINLFISITN